MEIDRAQFEALRDLPCKVIASDIVFQSGRDTRPNLTFDSIAVDNSLGHDVVLNGTYKPGIPSITFNFVLRGVGPICRVDVNGTIHGDAGRTHKHDLTATGDPRLNLPHAIARPDLEDISVWEVWQMLCQQAKITHTGLFVDPSESNAQL